jgi:hypothetical protein
MTLMQGSAAPSMAQDVWAFQGGMAEVSGAHTPVGVQHGRGHALRDYERTLPEAWTDGRTRCRPGNLTTAGV